MRRHRPHGREFGRTALVTTLLTALSGCDGMGVDATYGRSRGVSVNGTGVLAEMFRARGDQVRVALRLTDEVGDWADTIVRFAPYPGPPEKDEGDWYLDWLDENADHRLIYVPRDYDAESEYWSRMLDRLPKDADPDLRDRAKARRDQTATWGADLPRPARETAPLDEWFAPDDKPGAPAQVRRLEGPWSQGIDPAAAALTRHHALGVNSDAVSLLSGDGKPLVWQQYGDEGNEQVLIVANGSFLLNVPLVNRARRPLARRVVDWPGPAPRRVAFIESYNPTRSGQDRPPSAFALLGEDPFSWIAPHLGVFGLLACLAAAARLGRPRPEPPSGADRPAAHAEALGDLLAKSRDEEAARSLIDAYRRWRHPTTGGPSSRTRRRSP